MNRLKVIALALLLAANLNLVHARVTLPGIFGDHMVLQQKQAIHIWGWADPREKVTIQLAGQKKTAVTDVHGDWKVDLLPLDAGGPWQLIVTGSNLIKLEDVMIGEVWICSGQSNMEFTLSGARNATSEIINAANPNIRHIKIKNTISANPAKNIAGGTWEISSPETAGNFTAVGYYFAKKIQKEQHVAVGLINSSWGGTYAEAWMSHEAMVKNPDYATIPELSQSQLEDYYAGFEKKLFATFHALGTEPDKLTENFEEWVKPEFEDSQWLTVNLPEPWDANVLPGFDGVAWYRKTIDLPADVAQAGISVSLGKVEDGDMVYVNGVKIGSNNGNMPKSVYQVAPQVLKAGKNLITVRVEDWWEAGGFTGEAKDMVVTARGNYSQDIAGSWKMNLGKSFGIRIRTPNVHPNLLYNGMIAPLIPFSFRGVLWYQGESNADFAVQYRQTLPMLINDWRNRWNEGNFPFYIVQLANYNKFSNNTQNGGSKWAEVRESQFETTHLPQVDMVTITDIGDSSDIHPKNKEDVGSRLALLALKQVYGVEGVYHSPVFKNIQIEGNLAKISFELFGSNLSIRDRYLYLRGFEIAGADQKFYYAQARIKNNMVVVSSDLVEKPVAVRYSWSDNPDGNLFNAEGLPVVPFRTDTWKLSTEGVKFDKYLKL